MIKPKHPHIWADYNGPGKPITEKQVEELLAENGIYPHVHEDGQKYWHKEDFTKAWEKLKK